MPITSIPPAMAPENVIPITVSCDSFVLSERNAIRTAISIEKIIDDREKSIPRNAPTAIPANAACEIASEKNDILRNITKFPTKGQSMPTINVAITALWIKGYDKNSLIVFIFI
jgi:hypothetical protein